MNLELSVVIPTYNRVNILRETLQALFNQSLDRERFEIVVVDDGSEDGTSDMLVEIQNRNSHHIRTYRQKNGLAGSARNLGINKAKGGIVVFIDDDIKTDADLLKKHLEFHTKNPELEVAVLGRLITTSSGVDLIRSSKYESIKVDKENARIEVAYFATANISLKRQFIIQGGLFTPGLPCLQDTDLALRLKKRGLKLFYCPGAVGVHTQPIDTMEKLISSGKKYGRTLAEWYERIPQFQELTSFGARFDGGWNQLVQDPWQYFKDGVRRWSINKYTIGLILRMASNIPISNPPRIILVRLCKEIWSYYFRNEFHERRLQLDKNQNIS